MIFKTFFYGIFTIQFILYHIDAKYIGNFIVATKKSYASESSMRLVNHCLRENMKNFIILNDDSDNNAYHLKAMFDSQTPVHIFPINGQRNILERNKRYQKVYKLNASHIETKNYPISCAYINISNATKFVIILRKLKDSIWWSHQAFVIVANFNFANGCKMAPIFLKSAWNFNLLSAIYLCSYSSNETYVYTFNPYATIAPEPWKKVRVFNNNIKAPWSLFKISLERTYNLSDRARFTCSENLFFNKAKQLSGYNLKALIRNDKRMYRYNKAKVGYERLDGSPHQIMCTALKSMQANITIKESAALGYIDDYGEPCGLFQDIINGTVDILMAPYLIRDYWRLQTHSFMSCSLKIVSLKIPVTFVNKLAEVFTLNFVIFLCITSLICIGTLKFFFKISMSAASLEFMRIFVNSTTLNIPQNLSSKTILITCILVEFIFSTFILSIFSAIHSDTSGFLAIDTVKELINSNVTIVGIKSLMEVIGHEEISKRLNLAITNCSGHLLKGDRVACIYPNNYLMHFISKNKLIHVSRDSLATRSEGFIFPEDSPLISTFQSIFLRLNEGGFINFIFKREASYLDNIRLYEKNEDKSYQIEEFVVLFSILIGNWIIGILSMFLEIFIYNFTTNKINYLRLFKKKT